MLLFETKRSGSTMVFMERIPDTDSPNTADPVSPSSSQDDSSGWKYSKEANSVSVLDGSSAEATPLSTVEWSALEYQHQNKDAMWYAVALVSAVFVTALVYLITRDIFSAVIIVVVALLFFVSAVRKPQMQTCKMSRDGIIIASKTRLFSQYKAFNVDIEGSAFSFTLLPLKRFSPYLTVSFPADKYDDVVSVLQDVLPFEPELSDPLDSIAKRLRF